MKKLDLFIFLYVILGFTLFFSVITVNLNLFMGSCGILSTSWIVCVISKRFRKWLDTPIFSTKSTIS
jgi:hypothetical protein